MDPPVLYGGTRGPARLAWVLPLSFEEATCEEALLEVPGLGELRGLLVASVRAAELPGGLGILWRLCIAVQEGAVFVRVCVDVERGEGTLEHICLAPLAFQRFAGEMPCSPPSCSGLLRWFRPMPRRSAAHSSFFVNGWQSFGFSGVLHGAVAQPRPVLSYFSGAFHQGAKLPEAMVGEDPAALVSDMFGIFWLHGRVGLLGGFLSQSAGFGGLAAHSAASPRLSLFCESGAELRRGVSVSSDWGVLLPFPGAPCHHSEGREALGAMRRFFALIAKRLAPRRAAPVGWCSWYRHGPNVSEGLMMGSLKKLAAAKARGELPLEVFQLDDGWQAAWGDWTPHAARFPGGLRPLAEAARRAGFLPGIWLAPLAAVAESAVAAAHPDWILRDASGHCVSGGFTAPGVWMLALDATHPEVIAFVQRVVRRVVWEWGFGYLKCDFLHCACLPGVPHASLPRPARLERLMAAIREAAGPETFVLACGAPLGPCVGLVDAARVSADTAEHWLPRGPDLPGTRAFFARDETNLPAARNMLRNVMARHAMGALWVNDPDCLILRPEVPLEEARALATAAALSGGSLMLSEEVDELPPERLAILQALLPPLASAPSYVELLSPLPRVAVTELQGTYLVAIFAWGGDPWKLSVDLAALLGLAPEDEEWHLFEFWSQAYARQSLRTMAAFEASGSGRGCRLLALSRLSGPQVVGSSFHLACGSELALEERPRSDGRSADLLLRAGCAVAEPRLWLFLPGAEAEPRLSGGRASKAGRHTWELALPPLRGGEAVPYRVHWA